MTEKRSVSIAKAIDKTMREKKNTSLPHISALVESFIAAAGGMEAFGDLLWKDFQEAKPGSMTRLRVYDLISHAWRFSQQRDGGRDDLGILNEADLEREMKDILAKHGEAAEN